MVGGYSFGDLAVNHELARYLGASEEHRILVWNRSPDREKITSRLQKHLVDEMKVLDTKQVEVEPVELPDAAVVERLLTRLRQPGASR